MKNILTIIFVLAVTNMLYSQNTMYIHQKGGTVVNYALSSVDSITFGTSQGTVTDIDGNIYETVKICEQIWMKQNLKVTHYNNGVVIPKVTDATSWSNLATGARCYYNNDSATYNRVYGSLYNWFAANAGNLCPSGWHVPSDTEWTALENCLGGNLVAGGKMKEAGTTHWTTPNDGATNSSGFTGLPGGYRDSNGSYSTLYDKGCWWSATVSSPSYGWYRSLYYNITGVSRGSLSKNFGYYIRCLKN